MSRQKLCVVLSSGVLARYLGDVDGGHGWRQRLCRLLLLPGLAGILRRRCPLQERGMHSPPQAHGSVVLHGQGLVPQPGAQVYFMHAGDVSVRQANQALQQCSCEENGMAGIHCRRCPLQECGMHSPHQAHGSIVLHN